MADLTAKQRRFVAEYLVDVNATQAAIRAGYSRKTARSAGQRMLTHVDIAAAIQEGQHSIAEKLEVTAELVIAELAKIAFSNIADYVRFTPSGDPMFELDGLTRTKTAAIQEVTVEDFVAGRGEDARDVRRVKLKLGDKRAALVDLGRHLGLFTDNVNVKAVDIGARLEASRKRLRAVEAAEVGGIQ